MDLTAVRRALTAAVVAAFVVCSSARAQEQPTPLREAPEPVPALGMNLNGPTDWNTELPFVDVFRLSRAWISQREGRPWGEGPPLSLAPHGWVTELDPGCWAETPLCTVDGGHYPGGRYTVLYDGEGTLAFWNAGAIGSQQPGRIVINVDATKKTIWLRLKATDPQNYVRNIRVVMPGFEETYRENPFHPTFLDRWRGVACFRFMDWMLTNGSQVSKWSERPTLDDATCTTRGVPLELMIDLCNRQNADAWFCVPHLADDDYVRNFARMVNERLDPALKVYVEWSNETWNGMFPQTRYAGDEGLKLGFAEKHWEAAWRYTAYRSVQVFRIWEDVFGGTERLVRVLPTQAANPYVSERIVEFQDAWKHADALAVAPYISCNVLPDGERLNTAIVERWTVDEALDYMEDTALSNSIEWIRGQKKVADRYGLKLVGYEFGQHMVGVNGGENNEAVTKLFHAANAHPRMGEVYAKYYGAWVAAGGDLAVYFSSVGHWTKWGSWGIMQHYDDDPAASPKFMSTMGWAESLGQPVSLPEAPSSAADG